MRILLGSQCLVIVSLCQVKILHSRAAVILHAPSAAMPKHYRTLPMHQLEDAVKYPVQGRVISRFMHQVHASVGTKTQVQLPEAGLLHTHA